MAHVPPGAGGGRELEPGRRIDRDIAMYVLLRGVGKPVGGYAGFGPCFHLPGFMSPLFLYVAKWQSYVLSTASGSGVLSFVVEGGAQISHLQRLALLGLLVATGGWPMACWPIGPGPKLKV